MRASSRSTSRDGDRQVRPVEASRLTHKTRLAPEKYTLVLRVQVGQMARALRVIGHGPMR